MSGGAWDFRDRNMIFLAEDIRDGHVRWNEERTPELGAAREALATWLERLADLIREVDYHLCSDDVIEDEAAWLVQAKRRMLIEE